MLWKKLLRQIPFLFPLLAFAGQSLVLNGSSAISVEDPAIPANQSWRIEFQIHNWTAPPAGVFSAKLFELTGTGILVRLYPGGVLETESADPVTQQQPCFLKIQGLRNALVRIQKNVPSMVLSCEAWDYDGTAYSSQILNVSKLVPRNGSGGTIGPGAVAAIGFLRVATALLPLGARPPTTADGGDWTEWKFDGNLRDSGTHRHNSSGSGVSFMPTPNQVAIANPKTKGAPAWSNWVSLRAGFPAQLDGTASYSLADATSTVSCEWTELDGPSNVIWAGQNTPIPTLNGLIFGTYHFLLKVTDAAGTSAAATMEAAAVATDDNGVVVNADPNVDKIFGPMIAWGKNPWGYQDERAMTATLLRMASYKAQGYDPPPWATPQPGTVAYVFNGVGPGGSPATKLSGAVANAADSDISVADASVLDLSTFPTRILLGPFPREEVRICAASATKGPASLTVCYDGRGQSSPADGYRLAAQAWPAGTAVGQMRVNGAGTRFLSSICPTGPGPNGTTVYKSGTVRLTPGSTTLAGSGTTWNVPNNVFAGFLVRVSATHGGTPFVFSAYIASVADPAHITLARPYPKDADSGWFSYSIIRADFKTLTLHYNRPADGTDGQLYFQTSGCESDTDAYLYAGHDIASLNGTVQRSVKYGYMDGFGYTSAFGPNFYGEDLAHRALYYRSGWTPALQAARVFSDHFVSSPNIAGGDGGGIPLLTGGGIIGGFAAAVLDTGDPNRPSWSDLRGIAKSVAPVVRSGCNDSDSRDSGYMTAWLTLAAEFDPDATRQAEWKKLLGQLLVRDRNCKGADNSWANGFLWNNSGAPLNMANGSAIVSGTNLPKTMCFGIASGTLNVVQGSAAATGSGFVKGNQIAVTGTMKGQPYTGFFQFSVGANGSITMAALWPGDSGRATFVIENNDSLNTIATSNNDPQLKRNWACTWNNPSQITLNRPWDGPTEGGAHLLSYVLAGFGQQPYMLGIKITQMKFASQVNDPALSAAYAELAAQAATWVRNVGYDPVTQGLHYGRIMEACEPQTTPPPGTAFTYRTPGCSYGLEPNAVRAARVLTAEASQALRVYYESNPTPEAREWGDRAYGSIWGNPNYTTGGVYSDSNYVRDENSDNSLGAYKWTGFFFGMGMSHQWPAVRLGGVAPARPRRVSLEVRRGIAAKVQVSLTAPSGKVTVFPCEPVSPCEVVVDDRQGTHWYRVQYLSAEGKVVSQSDLALIGDRPDSPMRELSRGMNRGEYAAAFSK